jgi:hypothetical protein
MPLFHRCHLRFISPPRLAIYAEFSLTPERLPLSGETLPMRRMNLLPFFRKVHLYLGVFTAPAILFFAVTGALQTFSLHEASRDGEYRPANWIVVLAQIHKKQTPQLPVRKSQSEPPPAIATIPNKPQNPRPAGDPPPRQHSPLPLKIFFLVVAIALLSSTASGLYLAWKYKRDRTLMAVCLLAGVVVPILLAFI